MALWKKGESGNPGGRPKELKGLQELAREYSPRALQTLAHIAENGENEGARVAASVALLDRGWGKPLQQIAGADGGPLQITVMRFGEGDGLAFQLGGPKIIEAIPGEPLSSGGDRPEDAVEPSLGGPREGKRDRP